MPTIADRLIRRKRIRSESLESQPDPRTRNIGFNIRVGESASCLAQDTGRPGQSGVAKVTFAWKRTAHPPARLERCAGVAKARQCAGCFRSFRNPERFNPLESVILRSAGHPPKDCSR